MHTRFSKLFATAFAFSLLVIVSPASHARSHGGNWHGNGNNCGYGGGRWYGGGGWGNNGYRYGGYGYRGGYYNSYWGMPSIGFSYYSTPAYYYDTPRTIVYRRPVVTSYEASDALVTDVQRALARRGFYRGGIDGNAGPETRSAIRSYQSSHAMAVTGRINGPLLGALGLN